MIQIFPVLIRGMKFTMEMCLGSSSLFEYLSKAKEPHSVELNSAAFCQCHRSKKSSHTGRSNLSSLSSKTNAKARFAALEVETPFRKEKQALKIAEEELEVEKSLAKAKEEEKS